MPYRAGSTPPVDVWRYTGERGICRVEGGGRSPIMGFLIPNACRDLEAVELAGVANHRAPVVPSFGQRRRIAETVPGRAVVAHLLAAALVGGRVHQVAYGHVVVL